MSSSSRDAGLWYAVHLQTCKFMYLGFSCEFQYTVTFGSCLSNHVCFIKMSKWTKCNLHLFFLFYNKWLALLFCCLINDIHTLISLIIRLDVYWSHWKSIMMKNSIQNNSEFRVFSNDVPWNAISNIYAKISVSTCVWPSVTSWRCKFLCKWSWLYESLWHTRDHIIILSKSNQSVTWGQISESTIQLFN